MSVYDEIGALQQHVQEALMAMDAPFDCDAGGPLGWPPLRDSWATVYRWLTTGGLKRELRDNKPVALPLGLDLRAAPTAAPAVLYELPADQWFLLARHRPGEPVLITPDRAFSFSNWMLTYVTRIGDESASGRINLAEQPVWDGRLALPPGKRLGRWLHADDVAEDERRLHLCVTHFYDVLR